MLARSSWEAGLFLDVERRPSGVTVLDAERVLLIDTEGFRAVRIPAEYPPSGAWFEPEVMWSQPWADARPGSGYGVLSNNLVLADRTEDNYVWAYPLDGRDPFPFVPTSTLLHFGAGSVTGIGFHPDNTQRVSLYQRRHDGDLDVVADDLLSGTNDGVWGAPSLAHAWTPELGRIRQEQRHPWTAHQLASVYVDDGENALHSVIVTDRTVLDSQLQDTISQFERADGVIGKIPPEGRPSEIPAS